MSCSELDRHFKMADILSFSAARKKKIKAAKEEHAVQNRVKFGRTKAEKKLATLKNKKVDKNLSDHETED